MHADVVVVGASIVGTSIALELARRGIELLRGWSDHIGGDSGYEAVGYLLAVGNDQAEGCAANVALSRSLGVRTELVPADRLREVEPLLSADGLACGAREPESGLIDPVKVSCRQRWLRRRPGSGRCSAARSGRCA